MGLFKYTTTVYVYSHFLKNQTQNLAKYLFLNSHLISSAKAMT